MISRNINSLTLAKYLISQGVPKGGNVVDATAGRGRDTRFLAEHVGPMGKVWAFDIQAAALQDTQNLLNESGLANRVNLIHAGHERMGEFVAEPVDGIMFNLGYLPKGDKELITTPTTTMQGIESGLKLLKPAGLMTLVIYTGHPGGQAEADAVERCVEGLSQACFNVIKFTYPNRDRTAPYLVAIHKR
ncbi:MAG TPA: class I SAM-dependent methyltransferase [Verrucomicrobiae bacterium]|nr:class I SAM-dependent methyltransferase [Verrucomicrobiae bacterium]